MPTAYTHNGDADAEPDPRRWIALATLLIAGFMNLIDITIVNVALPRLQEGLNANSSQIEWVVAGYVLAFALGLLPFGRLGDIIGRRTMFLAGVAAFGAISALCGLAPNIEMLIIARILQGLAGAMMMPQVLAITQNIFPPHERGTAFSMFGLISSLAAVSGPVAGGFLITADIAGLDWRPIFLINIPIALFAVIAGLRLIPDIPGNRELTNDWIGILIAAIAIFLLIFPLVEGRTLGWPVWTFIMMAASLPGLLAFIMWQRRRERTGRSQLLPVALMQNRNYMIGTLAVMAFFSGIPGFFMIFAIFLQTGFELTPFQSGLTTTPFPIGIFIASGLSGRLGARVPKARLLAGTLLLIVGMVWVRQTISTLQGNVDYITFLGPLLVAGLGMGTTIAVLFSAVLSSVPGRDAGSGSGALQAFQQIGGAVGIAVIGEIFFSTLLAGGRPDQAGFVDAASNAMLFNIGMFGLVVVLALLLRTKPEGPAHSSGGTAGTAVLET